MKIDVGDMFSNDSVDYDKLDFYGNPIPNNTEPQMSVEKAIELLEEFKVIDDWSAVYMPDLHDAIDTVISAVNKNTATTDTLSDIDALKYVASLFIKQIRHDGALYPFDIAECDKLDAIAKLLKEKD